ncbi:gaf domain nucleotide-binding [Trichoderma arundinaceum]|uniref:Gaf domain nucleotide-binding n=1 Tax=Trichoderma arundinaceum TaxID=490622 RepID=A0A395N7T8_TRIAR|nr:gaf domain nucleotide-binding [Trichoderma arundinaceum]
MADDQDLAFKCWQEQVLTDDLYPSDHFFTAPDHHHQHLFDTSLHHVMPHHQQDRLGMSTPTFSPDATNAAFFQMPTQQQMAGVTGAGMQQSAPHHYRQDSPASTHSGGSNSKRRGTARSTDGDDLDAGSDEAQAAIKRQRNTMAARKYRQKRLDRIADLERALSDMTGERDDLKLKLARREAEVEALREMLGRK